MTDTISASAVSVAVLVPPRLLYVPPASRGSGKMIRPSRPARHYSGEWRGSPPCAGGALGGAGGEPVLPQHASHVRRWGAVNWILSKEVQDARALLQQSFLREHDPCRRAHGPSDANQRFHSKRG